MSQRPGPAESRTAPAPAQEVPTSRADLWTRRWVLLTIACVFGPYVVGGLRTEQLSLYLGAAVAGGFLLARGRVVRTLAPGWSVLVPWAAYVLVVAAAAFLVQARWPWGAGSLVAGLDNAVLPLATMTVVAVWMRLSPVQRLLRTACWAVVVGMAANGLVALLSAYVGIDRLPFLPGFWSSRGTEVTVAELASGSGRFSGLFNQPAEAGIAYTLAAICLVYLVRTQAVPRTVWVTAWALVLVGGFLAFSKIFVVGGVVIVAGLVLSGRRHRWLLSSTAVATAVLVFTLGAAGWLGSWGASTTLQWYVTSLQSGDSLIYTMTAGRYGEGEVPIASAPTPEAPPATEEPGTTGTPGATDQEPVVPPTVQQPGGLVELGREVFRMSPWFGLGATGAQVSYDSTWIESLIVGGAVGALLMLAVHLGLSVRWVRLRRRVPREEWLLGGAVLLLVWGSSLGMPSLTGNRESSLLWVVLSLLVVFRGEVADRRRAAASWHRAGAGAEHRSDPDDA